MQSKATGFHRSRSFHRQKKIIFSICVFSLGAIGFFLILKATNAAIPNNATSELVTLWEEQNYQKVVELTNNLLEESPLNSNYLFYNGISNFYYALSLINYDERQTRLDTALYSLRKLLHAPPIGSEDRIHYILGKIYFHKGPFYYDLSEKYLRSAEYSTLTADIAEYLGVIYLDTERQEEGITYLLRAITENPRDILYYTVAGAYEEMEEYASSLEYYQLSFNLTSDTLLLQESLIGQGRVLFAIENLEQAKAIFQQVIDNSPQAAEAYFYLGEIYALENDMVRARANWREAYNQNKTFTPALERLNS